GSQSHIRRALLCLKAQILYSVPKQIQWN
ncbi:hypothetical protein D043_4616B, partial [Vibrio parahaemolyticus EKP-021]